MVAVLVVIAFAAVSMAAQSKSPSGKSKSAPSPEVTSIVDMQVKATTAGQYLVRIQADGALAFDRLKSFNRNQILVRFYNARLVNLAEVDPPPFGALSWSVGGRGELTLIIDLVNPATRASVTQGGNPNVVEVRLRN